MRMIVIVLLLCAGSPLVAPAQWNLIHPATPVQRYLAYGCVSSQRDRWMAIGNDIAVSDDRGVTWQVTSANPLPVFLRPDQKYIDIFFPTEHTGFLAFESAIYKTTDSGGHWQKVLALDASHSHYAYSAYFHAISFIDENNGLAVGDFEKIFHTTDGGAQWTEVSWSAATRPYLSYTDVQFVDAGTGFIGGYEVSDILMNFGFDEFILRTDDGGQHWEKMFLPGDADFRMVELHFLDAARGYVHLARTQSNEAVFATADGGKTWRDVTPPALRIISSVQWQPGGVGFAFGQTHVHTSAYYRTADDGLTWTEISLPVFGQQDEFIISDMVFADAANGFTVGAGGNVLVTRDAGITWEVSNAGYPAFRTFDMTASAVGYASSGKGFFKTVNNGAQWQFQPRSDSLTILEMTFGDAARGTFYGWRNFYYDVRQEGAAVERLALPVNFVSLSALLQQGDSLFACGTTVSPRKNFLITSPDRGATWKVTEVPNVAGMIVQLERHGNHLYYGAGSSIVRSSASGTGWATVGEFNGDYLNGLAVLYDGTLLASFQSGSIRRREANSGLWSIVKEMPDAGIVDFVARGPITFAYGSDVRNGASYGAIWSSRDAGKTWRSEPLPITDYGIYDMDIEGNTVFASGGYGQIFSTPLPATVTGQESPLADRSPILYPVPTTDVLYVAFEQEKITSIELVRMDGARVPAHAERVHDSLWKLAMEHQARGVYVAVIRTERSQYQQRVVRK